MSKNDFYSIRKVKSFTVYLMVLLREFTYESHLYSKVIKSTSQQSTAHSTNESHFHEVVLSFKQGLPCRGLLLRSFAPCLEDFDAEALVVCSLQLSVSCVESDLLLNRNCHTLKAQESNRIQAQNAHAEIVLQGMDSEEADEGEPEANNDNNGSQ